MTNSKLRALLNFIIWMYKRKVLECLGLQGMNHVGQCIFILFGEQR